MITDIILLIVGHMFDMLLCKYLSHYIYRKNLFHYREREIWLATNRCTFIIAPSQQKLTQNYVASLIKSFTDTSH